VATFIYIYSKQSSPTLEREGRFGLEDDLEAFLAGVGEVTGGGSATKVCQWNIDLELTADAELETWIARISDFLRNWGVPEDTHFVIVPDDWAKGVETRRVNVFSATCDSDEGKRP
jgi:hypothetical protein